MSDTGRFETLHCHTTLSDGKLTHQQVLDVADRHGVGVVAFTDHDALPTPETLQILEDQRAHPTKWIVGIELSSGMPREVLESPHAVHLIGLFVDPNNPALMGHCAAVRANRLESLEGTVANLNTLGFTLSVADCLAVVEEGVVARPHIAQALLNHLENLLILDTLRERMRVASLDDAVLVERYTYMLKREETSGHRKQDVFELVLSNTAFIPDIFVPYADLPDLDAGVALIRNAGGVALIAHYHTIADSMSLELLDTLLREGRIDGAETVFGLSNYRNGRGDLLDEYQRQVAELVAQHSALAAGGVDAHGEHHFGNFADNPAYASRTVGMTARLLATKPLDTRWSSL